MITKYFKVQYITNRWYHVIASVVYFLSSSNYLLASVWLTQCITFVVNNLKIMQLSVTFLCFSCSVFFFFKYLTSTDIWNKLFDIRYGAGYVLLTVYLNSNFIAGDLKRHLLIISGIYWRVMFQRFNNIPTSKKTALLQEMR